MSYCCHVELFEARSLMSRCCLSTSNPKVPFRDRAAVLSRNQHPWLLASFLIWLCASRCGGGHGGCDCPRPRGGTK